jgi:hypothetical protein
MAIDKNHVLGAICIVSGVAVIIAALGTLLLRVIVGLAALSLINYGLQLRGLPPLQLLIPLLASRKRWF